MGVTGRVVPALARADAEPAVLCSPPTLLSVIVPVFNEVAHVESVLRRVASVKLPEGIGKEVIVVDDGSTDGTTELLRRIAPELGFRLHVCDSNAGKGAACRIGFRYVTGDVMLIQDADQEYDPSFYPKLLEPMIQGRAVAVYGSRFKGSVQGMRPANRIANYVLRVLANVLYSADITDEATGFKLLRIEVLRAISLSSPGFDLCAEITAKVRKAGFRIHEVPIDYVARTRAEGKKIGWRDGLTAIWTLVKYRFRS